MNILYTLKEGVLGFRRARLSMVVSIMTITMSLLILGLFALFYRNTSSIMQSFRDRIEMEAFIDQSAGEDAYQPIGKRIRAIPGVKSAAFISKQEASEIFRREFGEDVHRVLDFNPLPASYKITLEAEYRNPDSARAIHQMLSAIPGVDDIIYRRALLELIEKRSKVFVLTCLAVGILLTIGAVFLVSNTIRLAIFSKRKTITTMKLVGATRMFIRMPFIIEGLIQGLVGGVCATGLMYASYAAASHLIGPELYDFITIEPMLYPLVLATGLALGFLGSVISIRKFIGENVM
ncbi:MAG: permease-like cell division protein FtsX [Ignavibacteriales bacterium]|nr:permease-like cell division protein FtsX [Ignavibacteriales bacterium]